MSLLDGLRGGLIVSVQAWPGSAIDQPATLTAMALAAECNGAVAVRVQGSANLAAVRARVGVPIIGLIKHEYPGFEPYITPTAAEVDAVVSAGAEIVAFDATARSRPDAGTVAGLIERIHAAGRLAMADCAEVADAERAAQAGADLVGTTLCGYTPETAGHALPAIDLLPALAATRAFAVCEGGVTEPAQVGAALAAGAAAVVVGSAITNVDWLVRRFAGAATRQIGPLR